MQLFHAAQMIAAAKHGKPDLRVRRIQLQCLFIILQGSDVAAPLHFLFGLFLPFKEPVHRSKGILLWILIVFKQIQFCDVINAYFHQVTPDRSCALS